MASLDTAYRRSFEAEVASDAVQAESTVETHSLAADLHREAASWHARAGNNRRAARHRLQAKVHAHVAEQLDDQAEGRPE